MILSNGCHTIQVKYTNAFSQAKIQEEVYIEHPQTFGGAHKLHKVLKLHKIMYDLRQTPKTFFDKLKAGILERDFISSEIDKCVFMIGDLVCLVYVNDTILTGTNLDNINKETNGLGVSNEDQVHSCQLRDRDI